LGDAGGRFRPQLPEPLTIQLDPSQQQAAARLDALSLQIQHRPTSWAQKLRARLSRSGEAVASAPRGVYLWGAVGRGKTLVMDLFFESSKLPRKERTHFYRFMRAVHADLGAIKDREDPIELVAAQLAQRLDLLCLDEFFVSDIADAMILGALLTRLFRHGVALVITSNVPPKDLYREGLQRQRFLPAIAAIEAHMDVVHLDGGVDYRLRELAQAPTYLDSSLPATDAQLERRFASLAGGNVSSGITLNIEGRPIKARATGPGLVWFEFAEICEGPRSQNDYIELALTFHTVFISHVPLFTAANENAARRFIMLIDEFYDRCVNIVLSAAAPPTGLYQGEKLKFEFERAASRLIEMQTQTYLAGEHRQHAPVSPGIIRAQE
jgi:cell division protein ZapE